MCNAIVRPLFIVFYPELINPRRMRHRITVVVLCVCVCLSVTKLTATYLVCESKVQCYKVPYGVPKA